MDGLEIKNIEKRLGLTQRKKTYQNDWRFYKNNCKL
jgi:hypothetical protein